MWPDGAVDKELQQIGPQHVPIVVVVLLTFVAADDETANSLVRQQRFVHREIGEVGFDRRPLVRIQRLARLDGVERRRRIVRIVGERVRR